MKEKALFLDLDGTVIVTKSGEVYPNDVDDWRYIDGVLDKIKMYAKAGYHICIVTNQGGIELGYTSMDQMTSKLESITDDISRYIGKEVSYAFCGNMESYNRKPNPGMAYQVALRLELSLRASVMVGDKESDATFAKNAFIGTYLDIKDFLEEENIIEYAAPDKRVR